MSHGAAEVDESSLSEENDVSAVGEGEAVDLLKEN
jgi:hypothetical protein